jgi:hypothetical protein
MHNEPSQKPGDPAPSPMEQGEVDRLEAPAENQGGPVEPDKASGGDAHPGFGHAQSAVGSRGLLFSARAIPSRIKLR